MAISEIVELTVEYTIGAEGSDPENPFTLRATVTQANFIDQHVFLFQRVIEPGCEAVDEFCAVVTPASLQAYPIITPEAGNPFFRNSVVELELPSGERLEEVLTFLKADLAKLVKDWQVISCTVPNPFSETYRGE